MNTFKKKIKFSSKVFDLPKQSETCDGWVRNVVEKEATFKELSEVDSDQHDLFFLISPLFTEQRQIGTKKTKLIADPLILKDLTIKAIDCLLIEDENFNIQDKTEFLQDGMALMKFAQWFLNEKFTGFFLNSIESY